MVPHNRYYRREWDPMQVFHRCPHNLQSRAHQRFWYLERIDHNYINVTSGNCGIRKDPDYIHLRLLDSSGNWGIELYQWCDYAGGTLYFSGGGMLLQPIAICAKAGAISWEAIAPKTSSVSGDDSDGGDLGGETTS